MTGAQPSLRVLFLADTHLGFDLPVRPRVTRRRRGHDFFANFERALEAALTGRVDFVVHGGDLFFRSRVPASLVQRGLAPIKRVADAGIPVLLVPGNHERSRIPYEMFALHERIHIFRRPETFVASVDGVKIAFAGFPYCRHDVRGAFPELLQATGWRDADAEIKVLCIHQCVEGATVGPTNYTFRHASGVVRAADIPRGLAAVLSGHIHRHQILMTDLRGRPLAAPVLYSGSIERTSFAEKDEPKGYLLLECRRDDAPGGALGDWGFCLLPARPMVVRDLRADGASAATVEAMVRRAIREASANAVLRLRVHGAVQEGARGVLAAANIRSIAPATMNVDVRLVAGQQ